MKSFLDWDYETENEDGEIVDASCTAYYEIDIDPGDYYQPPFVEIWIYAYDGDEPDEDEEEKIREAILEQECETAW